MICRSRIKACLVHILNVCSYDKINVVLIKLNVAGQPENPVNCLQKDYQHFDSKYEYLYKDPRELLCEKKVAISRVK